MFRGQAGIGLTQQFIAALHAGRVCLHPTDTLPGLTFDPTHARGRQALLAVKGRPEAKPLLALVATPALARRFFAPLPGDWGRILGQLWPAPLSVVWRASSLAPAALIAADGTIGLRVPLLHPDAAWFHDVLDRLDMPLPTTSVNRSGDPAITTFAAAGDFLRGEPWTHVPAWDHADAVASASSTVIKLHQDGSFTLLRAGAMLLEQLQHALDVPRTSLPQHQSLVCQPVL